MRNLKSFLEKTFLGEACIEKINSPVNGEITIYDGWFGKSMRIGGITQSGELVQKLWKIGLLSNPYHLSPIKNCLILGLGCGDAAKLISRKWPGVKLSALKLTQKWWRWGKSILNLIKFRI